MILNTIIIIIISFDDRFNQWAYQSVYIFMCVKLIHIDCCIMTNLLYELLLYYSFLKNKVNEQLAMGETTRTVFEVIK